MHDTGFAAAIASRRMGMLARTSAVAFLGAAILHGVIVGGHASGDGPLQKLPGKLAGLAGMAADDVRISGLVHQDPETVLAAVGVKPGGSLIGFDAIRARNILENLDWVKSAKVQLSFPNQLEIEVAEREPFAVWQRDGAYYVIDSEGVAMSSIAPSNLPTLPLVTGEGAQTAVAELVNQLEAHPALQSRVRAAARVGQRRWTLYLDTGVRVALPERDVEAALVRAERLDTLLGLYDKGVSLVDLRVGGRIIVGVAQAGGVTAGDRPMEISQRQ